MNKMNPENDMNKPSDFFYSANVVLIKQICSLYVARVTTMANTIILKLVWQRLGKRKNLGREDRVVLCGVPVHIWFSGNEKTILLAKKAATISFVGLESFCRQEYPPIEKNSDTDRNSLDHLSDGTWTETHQ